ncbi:hypothetical protein OUZ56_010577 [Daphnia magna]|uniref:Uncharacterized protein n=1 Tax=Daphnia magna TaxID=35525 RepID=A0ABR0AJ05_9CRUS|nr:hypothetical protein OUZ56_010577 [Daphnia magna]
MSGQENRSSKRVQGISASPPLPLVTRRNKIPNRGEEEEDVDFRTTAENSPRRKCGFNSQAGKRQPPNSQGAAASAETDERAAQRHSSKVEDHKGRDSGFADRSQLERTWELPQSPTRQPTPRRPVDEKGDRSSQGSRPSLTWDTSDLTSRRFFSVQNAESQPEDERDGDELYTPRRLWNERRAEYQPATGDTDLSYRQLSSESDEESDGT